MEKFLSIQERETYTEIADYLVRMALPKTKTKTHIKCWWGWGRGHVHIAAGNRNMLCNYGHQDGVSSKTKTQTTISSSSATPGGRPKKM